MNPLQQMLAKGPKVYNSADRRAALKALDKNLDTETLVILAEKSKNPGIKEKLKKYRAFI
jgi:hypothetical protein